MTTSRDIESLFQCFGGDAGQYQEVRAEVEADEARSRWPLLGVLDPVSETEIEPSGDAAHREREAAPAASPAPLRLQRDGEPAQVQAPAQGWGTIARIPLDQAAAPGGAVTRPAAPSAEAGVRPVGGAGQPGPLLKKLFSKPAPPAAEPAPEGAVPLDRLFDRLRGGQSASGGQAGQQAADGRQWFIGGVRRS